MPVCPLLMLWTAATAGIVMCQNRVAVEERLESACGYEQTSSGPKSTSVLPPKADLRASTQEKSPAGAGRRCRSWRRASWPVQGPSCAPGDPCGAARASPPRPVSGKSAAGSTAGRGIGTTTSGAGHLTRSRPQDSASNAAAPRARTGVGKKCCTCDRD